MYQDFEADFRDTISADPVFTSDLWYDVIEESIVNPDVYLNEAAADRVRAAINIVATFVDELANKGLIVIEE